MIAHCRYPASDAGCRASGYPAILCICTPLRSGTNLFQVVCQGALFISPLARIQGRIIGISSNKVTDGWDEKVIQAKSSEHQIHTTPGNTGIINYL